MGTRDWKDFYEDTEEELPLGIPDALGKSAHTACFIDSNHAGNVITRCLYTGVLIYVINATIICLSKKQNTVESSMFGYEFVTMWIVIYIFLCYVSLTLVYLTEKP